VNGLKSQALKDKPCWMTTSA